jgi:hypothetical protein
MTLVMGSHLSARRREGRRRRLRPAGLLLGPDSGADDLGPGHGHGPGGLSFPLFFCSELFYFIFYFAFYLLHFGSKQIQTTL